MITEALIIRKSGEYDCEVVTKLKIDRMRIQRITNLESCISLIDLNLSYNEISQMIGLESLVLLKRLDLSFNKIRRIENVEDLVCLEMLDLRANQISQVDSVSTLSELPKLVSFHLRDSDGTNANPACDHPAYRNIVTRSLPKLQILDGSLIGLTEASNEIEKHLELLTPNTSDFELSLKTLPPWIPSNIINDNSSISTFSTSVDDMMDKYPQLKETYESINDMLNEDSGHLLRLANSALSKAQIK